MDEPRNAKEPFPDDRGQGRRRGTGTDDIPVVRAGGLEKSGASTRSLSELARHWVASGGGRVPVSGRSMRPTFDDASRVWMKADPQIRFGDVIVFVNEDMLVVHRVVGAGRGGGPIISVRGSRGAHAAVDPSRSGDRPIAADEIRVQDRLFRTKGDGLPHLDPVLVPSSWVLGRVIAVERDGRRYSTDGPGGRWYGRTMGAGSAIEGFFYRFAYRLDRALGAVLTRGDRGGGPMILRAVLRGAGRAAAAMLDRALFRLMNREEAGSEVGHDSD